MSKSSQAAATAHSWLSRPAARHILEGAVAAIVEEGVSFDAGDEQVGMSVVVIIGRGDADVEAGACHAGLVCDIFERPVVAVPVEAVAILRARFFERWLLCAIGEIDVGIAVVIVIEDGHAAGHGLNQVLLR